jgi:hypothetical protein
MRSPDFITSYPIPNAQEFESLVINPHSIGELFFWGAQATGLLFAAACREPNGNCVGRGVRCIRLPAEC